MDRRKSFRDARKTFTEEQVKIETARCLGAAHLSWTRINVSAAAWCTTKCEFDAIHLYREHPECSKMYRSEDKVQGNPAICDEAGLKIKFEEEPVIEKER